jgi:hypothetical protein
VCARVRVSPLQDDKLSAAVRQNEGKSWKKIAACLPGRSDVQCLHRWQKVLKPGLVKGPWTEEVCVCVRGYPWPLFVCSLCEGGCWGWLPLGRPRLKPTPPASEVNSSKI